MSSTQLRRKGGQEACNKCKRFRTGRIDGICYRCENDEAKDELLKRFAVEYPVRFPVAADTELPCEGLEELFLTPSAKKEAREICASCPVQQWCFTFGMLNDQWGTWGGYSQKERRAFMAVVKTGSPQTRYVLIA